MGRTVDEPNDPVEPNDAPIIEEVRQPGVAAEKVEDKRPGSDREAYIYVGEVRSEVKSLKEDFEKLKTFFADAQMATAEALAADAKQDEMQSQVIDEIAAKVLPEDSETAIEHNPDHAAPKCKWYEALLGGCPKR